MVSVRHPWTPRTNRHDKGRVCLQEESSVSQLINDSFASFFCRVSSIPFNVITKLYEAHAREALETMPDAWYMALWVPDTVIITITIISRRDKSKPSTHLVEECIKLHSLWAWEGLDGSRLGNERCWTLVSDSLSTCRDSLLCISV